MNLELLREVKKATDRKYESRESEYVEVKIYPKWKIEGLSAITSDSTDYLMRPLEIVKKLEKDGFIAEFDNNCTDSESSLANQFWWIDVKIPELPPEKP